MLGKQKCWDGMIESTVKHFLSYFVWICNARNISRLNQKCLDDKIGRSQKHSLNNCIYVDL